MFEFVWLWAFALIPLPWLINRLITEPEQTVTVTIPGFNQHNASTPSTVKFAPTKRIWFYLIWCLLCIAAANPVHFGEPMKVPNEGREIMLAVDLSGSMVERDMEYKGQLINRLTMVKNVLGEFIMAREGDRLGLIFFGDTAFLQTPLTRDVKTVQTMLTESEIGLVGKSTAIGDAVGLAVKRFNERKNSNKILILLSDGQNSAGNLDPEQALILAKDAGVKIHSVGVSSENTRDIFGFFNTASSLDEGLLKKLAEQTGGRYFKATDVASLQAVYQELDKLEPIAADDQTYRPQQALFYYPLAAALLCLVIATSLRRFKQTSREQ